MLLMKKDFTDGGVFNMLSVAVCDDVAVECADIAKRIETILRQHGADCIIKTFFSGRKLLQDRETFDLIFLDIKMPDISGMELARELRAQEKESLIVFMTSAREYVFEAFDVEAFQYLIKPLQNGKLKMVLERAVRKLGTDTDTEFLVISAGREIKKVLLKDILYIESVGRIAIIHCSGGTMETYEQIGVLEQKLSAHSFFRCHKCYLVHLDYVDSFDKMQVRLENGETILLAKRRYEAFQKVILSYMKRKGGIL